MLVGDGGMTFCLEKRGYVKAGPWSPECTVESPEAGQDSLICYFQLSCEGYIVILLVIHFTKCRILVRQVHREFLRAGADVIQAFSFSMDDKVIDEKVYALFLKSTQNFPKVYQDSGICIKPPALCL